MEKGAARSQADKLREAQNLYGVRLFQFGEYPSEDIEAYIARQEITHIAEGLELQQRTVRELPFIDGHVRGFGDRPMVEINEGGYREAQRQYLAGDMAALSLVRRREHDVAISERADELMTLGIVGDGFFVASPYAEELDDATAERLGFWPQFRRSYVWFYRKKSSTQLECVDVSIDQSSLPTYKKLLANYREAVPETAKSHDLPAYAVAFHADEAGRELLVDTLIRQYKAINLDPNAKEADNGFEAVDFLDKHARHYIRLLVDVHRSIATSLQTGTLQELVRLSAIRALEKLRCLAGDEAAALHALVADEKLSGDHDLAFSTLITAQRYGVWEVVSNLADGSIEEPMSPVAGVSDMAGMLHTIRLIDDVYRNTNQAAAQFKTMPGCAGGTSFLQQDEAEVRSSIFSGDRYSFSKKMFCLVCQAPPKNGAKPKWCGPCGICRRCDVRLQSKAS